jgi:hypothetical protein
MKKFKHGISKVEFEDKKIVFYVSDFIPDYYDAIMDELRNVLVNSLNEKSSLRIETSSNNQTDNYSFSISLSDDFYKKWGNNPDSPIWKKRRYSKLEEVCGE